MNTKDAGIREAMQAISERHKRVMLDTSRPKYHFVSPAKILLDVWGGIFHKGYYHLFYDLNHRVAEEIQGGCFGHLRSVDLVEWEDMPLALLPEYDKGESQLNDGTVVIDPSGQPLMYYTRCFPDATKNREHIPAKGSDDLVSWERINDKIMTMDNHGGPTFDRIWSDPVIFSEDGRTFMIISKCTRIGGGDMIPIYEAVDDTLLNWEYKGVFAEHTGEVINFIKIRDKWVLIYSPFNNPKYFVGTFDVDTYKFTSEKGGTLCYGYVSQGQVIGISRGFYATSAFYGEDNTPYVVGWLSGFIDSKDWQGGVSLVRTLDIDEENNVIMAPIPQLDKLREEKLELSADGRLNCGRAFEVEAEFSISDGDAVKIKLTDSFELNIGNGRVSFNDIEFDYVFRDTIKVKMYIDVSVAEIFFDNGRTSISRCFREIKDGAELEVFCNEKSEKFEAYKLRELYD